MDSKDLSFLRNQFWPALTSAAVLEAAAGVKVEAVMGVAAPAAALAPLAPVAQMLVNNNNSDLPADRRRREINQQVQVLMERRRRRPLEPDLRQEPPAVSSHHFNYRKASQPA